MGWFTDGKTTFPIVIGINGAEVVLHADGRVSGSTIEFMKELKQSEWTVGDPLAIAMWSVAAHIRAQEKHATG